MNSLILEKISELKQTNCHKKVATAIQELIETGSDFDLYKINAFRVAEKLGVDQAEALRGFLFATRLGLFDMSWDIYCPSCRGLPEYHRHMMGLQQRGHCLLCQIDWNLDFEKQVEVTFTLNPSIRALSYSDFHQRDFSGMMDFIEELGNREGRQLTLGRCVEVGKPLEIEHIFAPGKYVYWVTEKIDNSYSLDVSQHQGSSLQQVDLNISATGEITPGSLQLNAGPVCLHIKSSFPGMQGFLLAEDRPVNNWVSAHYVAMQQDFKDLFDSEFLSPETSFGVKNLTLMFTDLKDSTRMYEEVGDARAYTLVKRHFEAMVGSIRKFEGGIVKTIGDAVMAAFPTSEQALEAAIEVQEKFSHKNRELEGLQVKIGIHRGPVIAVNSNNHLDYFGRTVNMAARVQGKSLEGEVLLSEEVFQEQTISSLIAERRWPVRTFSAQLKGISPDPTLYSVSLPG